MFPPARDLGWRVHPSIPAESGESECERLGYCFEYFAVRDFVIAATNLLFQSLPHHHLLASGLLY